MIEPGENLQKAPEARLCATPAVCHIRELSRASVSAETLAPSMVLVSFCMDVTLIFLEFGRYRRSSLIAAAPAAAQPSSISPAGPPLTAMAPTNLPAENSGTAPGKSVMLGLTRASVA